MKQYLAGHITKDFAPDVEQTRTIQFVISSAAKDRQKTVVNMDNWQLDNFNRNPIVGYQHNVYGDNLCTPPNPDDVLGQGKAWTETIDGKKVLMGSVQFETADVNPLAEKIFRKVLAGTLRSTSVGFMEVGKGEWKKEVDEKGAELDKTYFFKGQELLEFSIVNIPANPEAVRRSINHHSDAALGYICRLLPSLSIAQIKTMKVQDVMDLVQKRLQGEELVAEQSLEEVEDTIKDFKKNLVTYMKLKNSLNRAI